MARFQDWRDWRDFEPSRPKEAKGGIRAQAQRGSFGESWWARRWIGALETFHLGNRLSRGRSYARKGQVLSIAIEPGSVRAEVQGSRPQPYRVSIELKPLKKEEWQKVADAVSSQAIYAAKLLGGEIPQDIERAFESAGVALFPQRYTDLRSKCSCPDVSNPCKHIAAVYYLLGEEFDRDPFLIFQLRGMGREEFLGLLGESGAVEEIAEEVLPPEPLPSDEAELTAVPELPEHPVGDVQEVASRATLPRRLGKFPFWRGRENLLAALDEIYREAGKRASDMLNR
jgi:uncharacterized Zn finger protein